MLNLDLPPTEIYTLQDPGLDGLIRECKDQRVLAFDTETSGLDITRDMPLFWSLAFKERKICLTADTLPAFSRVFGDDSKTFVGHNIKYDVHMLANRGIRVGGRWRDTSVMHAMLFENEQHGLKVVSKKLLGWGWSSFGETFKTKKRKVKGTQKYFIQQAAAGMKHLTGPEGLEPVELVIGEDSTLTKEALLWYWKHDPSALADYASNDAYGTMKLDQVLMDLLEKETIFSMYPEVYGNMLHLYLDTEMPFTQVLWKCERNGIFVDQDYLSQTEKPVLARLEEIEREFARKAGRVIRLTSNDDLATYLFGPQSQNCLGLRPRKMTSGGKRGIQKPSVDEKVLESLSDECVEAELALEHRQLKKLLGTYVSKIGSLVGPDRRLHPQYNQDTARCMPAGELVLTNRGYIPVESVVVGDLVLSHTGKARKVIETSKHAPSPIYTVRLVNGVELRTNGEHPYASGSQWAEAQELEAGMPVWVHATAVEEWAPIEGWKPFEVSTWGRVRNARTGNFVKQYPKGDWGHLKVQLYRYGAQSRGEDRKDFPVHRLVAGAFLGKSDLEVRHLNGIAWDNNADNLAYGTSHENRQDALRHGTMSQRRAGRTKLTEKDVAEIRAAKVIRGDYELSRAKLSWEQVQEIRAKYTGARGEQTALAKEYGVTQATVHNIVRYKDWKAGERPDGVTIVDLAQRYRVNRYTIEQILSGERWQDEDYIEENPVQFFQIPIESVTVGEAEETYGLTVEVDESHVTGGIVTHNTGRLSSKAPNIQNQPTLENDKFGIRKSFIAEPGNTLLVFDYKALEMRLLAAAAQEEPMIEAFRQKRDPHMANASMIFGVPYEDVVAAKKIDKQVKEGVLPESALTQRHHDLLGFRAAAKTLGFGLVYGMREGKLARDLKITKPEAVELRKKFMRQFPAVERLLTEAITDAIALNCKSYTYLGRRRHLPALLAKRPLDRFQAERQCVNLVVQGSAADLVRMAMLRVAELNLEDSHHTFMLMQVHDELVFECPTEVADEVFPIIKETMEHPFPRDLDVPIEVDGGRGHSWGTAK